MLCWVGANCTALVQVLNGKDEDDAGTRYGAV